MPRRLAVCILLFCTLIPLLKGQDVSILDKRISVRFNDASLPVALRTVSRVAQVNFSYNSNIVPRTKINGTYFNVALRAVLTDLLELENLFYKEVSGNIVILKRPPTEKSIIGRVIDATTKVPLQFASAFIDNSSLGDATDFYGFFRIDNVPDFDSRLIVSHVGYKPHVEPFPLATSSDTIQIELEMEITVIGEFTVSAPSRKKRNRQDRNLLKRFKVDFLGRSVNAKNCRIVNPHVLEFTPGPDSTRNYTATANQPLLIENMAMGYDVSFQLEEFKFENGLVTRKGQARFTELEPKSRRKNNKWEAARKAAYLGSDMHFLHALLDGKTFEEGFRVNLLRYDSTTAEYSSPLTVPQLGEILKLQRTNHLFQRQLKSDFDIEITYQGEFEDENYIKMFRDKSKGSKFEFTDRKSRSTIDLGSGRALISHEQTGGIDFSSVPLFQKSVIAFRNRKPVLSYPGYFNNVDDVIYMGWWTWGGFSEMLPLNYRPPK